MKQKEIKKQKSSQTVIADIHQVNPSRVSVGFCFTYTLRFSETTIFYILNEAHFANAVFFFPKLLFGVDMNANPTPNPNCNPRFPMIWWMLVDTERLRQNEHLEHLENEHIR